MRSVIEQRYGPWALVAGGAAGIGAAHARLAAANGVIIFLISAAFYFDRSELMV